MSHQHFTDDSDCHLLDYEVEILLRTVQQLAIKY